MESISYKNYELKFFTYYIALCMLGNTVNLVFIRIIHFTKSVSRGAIALLCEIRVQCLSLSNFRACSLFFTVLGALAISKILHDNLCDFRGNNLSFNPFFLYKMIFSGSA